MSQLVTAAVRRGEDRSERGQVLVFVLAMLVVVGVLAGALLSQSTPSFRRATSVSQLNDRMAAAKAGVESALQRLKEDSAFCHSSGSFSGPASPMANNLTPTVTCRRFDPANPLPGFTYFAITSTVASASGGQPLTSKAVAHINDNFWSISVDSWWMCQESTCSA
jgi:Tfp pilus assembly protein PilX